MKLGGLMALGFAAFATGTKAAIITTTWIGTVASGVDATGLFGAQGADLTGLSMRATFITDDSLRFTRYSWPLGQYFVGGSPQTGSDIAPTIAEIDIGGAVYSFSRGNIHSGVSVGAGEGWNYFSTGVTQIDLSQSPQWVPLNAMGFGLSARTPFMKPRIRQQFDFATNPPGAYGEFSYFSVNQNNRPRLKFAITSAKNVVTGPVPEPSSWALIISGFAVSGAVLRRRRSMGVLPA